MRSQHTWRTLAPAWACAAWLAGAAAPAFAVPPDADSHDLARIVLDAETQPGGPGPGAPTFALRVDGVPIPEPDTAVLLGLGLAGLVRAGRPRAPHA